jgi:hypothetical protein
MQTHVNRRQASRPGTNSDMIERRLANHGIAQRSDRKLKYAAQTAPLGGSTTSANRHRIAICQIDGRLSKYAYAYN